MVAGAVAYWWLLVESHPAGPGGYAIDIGEVRRLAGSQAGEGPRTIRVETVAHLAAPKTFVVAGDGWDKIDLPVSSYELVYPDKAAIVDAALDAGIAKTMSASSFDAVAYARLSAALAKATLIVVTHEHPDHVGGLLAQRDLGRLLASALLTREQTAQLRSDLRASPFDALHVPAATFASYRPLDYGRYKAIAPGVVLIKAPGHTPGSQMVYVRRADGTEFLLLGDVAWTMRNVETGREKARLVSWLSGEERGPVREELTALGRLHAAEPGIHMMAGHDAAGVDGFVRAGLMAKGF